MPLDFLLKRENWSLLPKLKDYGIDEIWLGRGMESRNLTGENIKPWKKPIWEGTFLGFCWTLLCRCPNEIQTIPGFQQPDLPYMAG
jgi:hypothetical protein